jgi:Sec-independent protein translocase protein TatA
MATDLADAIRALGVDLRKAVAEGRTAMSQREAELNEQLQARTGADT